jgi:hypothetical protein
MEYYALCYSRNKGFLSWGVQGCAQTTILCLYALASFYNKNKFALATNQPHPQQQMAADLFWVWMLQRCHCLCSSQANQ